MPLNAFGEDLKKAGFRWTEALCRMDSDGDGRTNGEELGDPCCSWSAEAPGEVEGWPWESLGHPGVADADSQSGTGLESMCEVVVSSLQPVAEDQLERVDVVFLKGEPQKMHDFRVHPHFVSPATDAYVDYGFNWADPDCVDNECQIVGAKVLLDNAKYVHHFILMACKDPLPVLVDGGPMVPSEMCEQRIAGWIPGRDYFMLAPDTAGLSFGGVSGSNIQGFQLQVHYHNHNRDMFKTDSSGFRLFYTTKPRPMRLGQFHGVKVEWDVLNAIPPGRDRFFVTEGCRLVGMDAPATLVSVVYHAHMIATEMYTTLYRENGEKIAIHGDAHWNFNDQYSKDLQPLNVTVFNGDFVQSSCVFDSTSKDSRTTFGIGSENEMCFAVYWVMPQQPKMRCISPGYWEGDLEASDDAHAIREEHPPGQGLAYAQNYKNARCDDKKIQDMLLDSAELANVKKECEEAIFSMEANRKCGLAILDLYACTVEGRPGSDHLSVDSKSRAMKLLQRLLTYFDVGSDALREGTLHEG